MEDYLVRMKQLAMQAGYDIDTHAKTLVRLMRQGLKNNVVEYVERSMPNLMETDNVQKREKALICADQILREIEDRKKGG